jgi:hypothetical protein
VGNRLLSRKLPLLVPFLVGLSMFLGLAGREIAIEGRVICVDSGRTEIPCASEAQDFALRTERGELFFFDRNDAKSPMFQDPRVRERTLHVKAWTRDDDYLDIIKVFSRKNGRLHDLHYYCSVCSITAFAGGPCWCCQQEFEFREVPIADPN